MCVSVCVHKYMHKHINTTCCICFCCFVYMVSGLTTLHWRTNNGAYVLKRLIALLPAVSSILKFFVQGLNSLKDSPSIVTSPLIFSFSCHPNASFPRKDCFRADFLVFWLSKSFRFFYHAPWVTDVGAVIIVILGLGFPQSIKKKPQQ